MISKVATRVVLRWASLFLPTVALLGMSLAREQVQERSHCQFPSLSGKVVDSSFLPLPGVEVVLKDLVGQRVRTVNVGQDGNYLVCCLPDGEYSLSFQFPGFLTNHTIVNYRYPHTLVVDQLMSVETTRFYEPHDMTFLVVDARTSEPLAGVEIQVAGSEQFSRTDECGMAWSDGVRRPETTVRIEADGYQPWERQVRLESEGQSKRLIVRLKPVG